VDHCGICNIKIWCKNVDVFVMFPLYLSSRKSDPSVNNSDLELAGGLLHLEAIAQHFDVRERTI
jgi:hypothetical protein